MLLFFGLNEKKKCSMNDAVFIGDDKTKRCLKVVEKMMAKKKIML